MKDWLEKSIRQSITTIEGGDFVDLGSSLSCHGKAEESIDQRSTITERASAS